MGMYSLSLLENRVGEQGIDLCIDSRKATPGCVFVALPGSNADGGQFIADAVARGAGFVVCRPEHAGACGEAEVVDCAEPRRALGLLARARYGTASLPFPVVGVTGTNGKTTTSYLLDHLFASAGKKTGVLGTVSYRWPGHHEDAPMTTPDCLDVHAMLADMRNAGVDMAFMEVSSHALDQDRVAGVDFGGAVFSNLTQDHLDYHHTFEAYFEAKALLFSHDYPARRVICVDDKWGAELNRRCMEAGDMVVTTGFDESAAIHPVKVDYGVARTDVVLSVRGEEITFSYPLVGRFNVSNIMTAFGVGLMLGIPAADIAKSLEDANPVPGRLERVRTPHDGGVSVYVDYAHTPDALEKALGSIMALGHGRTIVVFGCGGNRDAGKRPLMGKKALAADYAIVTSDNPRHENPDAIIADIVAGMGDSQDKYEVVPDRRSAIRRAIELADANTSVLIAGKGHEDYQLVGDEVLSFDDRVVAREELERRFAGAAAEAN